MAVVLRLSRHGQTKRPFYRLVAAEKTCRRDGRFIEVVGNINTLLDPPAVVLKEDKIRKWVANGAQLSSVTRDIIRKAFPNLVEERESHQTKKIQERRRQRKERARKRAK